MKRLFRFDFGSGREGRFVWRQNRESKPAQDYSKEVKELHEDTKERLRVLGHDVESALAKKIDQYADWAFDAFYRQFQDTDFSDSSAITSLAQWTDPTKIAGPDISINVRTEMMARVNHFLQEQIDGDNPKGITREQASALMLSGMEKLKQEDDAPVHALSQAYRMIDQGHEGELLVESYRIRVKHDRTDLAAEMLAGHQGLEIQNGTLTIDGTEYEVKDLEILTGVSMVDIDGRFAHGFKLMNGILIRESGKIQLLAQMENGCEGNLVVGNLQEKSPEIRERNCVHRETFTLNADGTIKMDQSDLTVNWGLNERGQLEAIQGDYETISISLNGNAPVQMPADWQSRNSISLQDLAALLEHDFVVQDEIVITTRADITDTEKCNFRTLIRFEQETAPPPPEPDCPCSLEDVLIDEVLFEAFAQFYGAQAWGADVAYDVANFHVRDLGLFKVFQNTKLPNLLFGDRRRRGLVYDENLGMYKSFLGLYNDQPSAEILEELQKYTSSPEGQEQLQAAQEVVAEETAQLLERLQALQEKAKQSPQTVLTESRAELVQLGIKDPEVQRSFWRRLANYSWESIKVTFVASFMKNIGRTTLAVLNGDAPTLAAVLVAPIVDTNLMARNDTIVMDARRRDLVGLHARLYHKQKQAEKNGESLSAVETILLADLARLMTNVTPEEQQPLWDKVEETLSSYNLEKLFGDEDFDLDAPFGEGQREVVSARIVNAAEQLENEAGADAAAETMEVDDELQASILAMHDSYEHYLESVDQRTLDAAKDVLKRDLPLVVDILKTVGLPLVILGKGVKGFVELLSRPDKVSNPEEIYQKLNQLIGKYESKMARGKTLSAKDQKRYQVALAMRAITFNSLRLRVPMEGLDTFSHAIVIREGIQDNALNVLPSPQERDQTRASILTYISKVNRIYQTLDEVQGTGSGFYAGKLEGFKSEEISDLLAPIRDRMAELGEAIANEDSGAIRRLVYQMENSRDKGLSYQHLDRVLNALTAQGERQLQSEPIPGWYLDLLRDYYVKTEGEDFAAQQIAEIRRTNCLETCFAPINLAVLQQVQRGVPLSVAVYSVEYELSTPDSIETITDEEKFYQLTEGKFENRYLDAFKELQKQDRDFVLPGGETVTDFLNSLPRNTDQTHVIRDYMRGLSEEQLKTLRQNFLDHKVWEDNTVRYVAGFFPESTRTIITETNTIPGTAGGGRWEVPSATDYVSGQLAQMAVDAERGKESPQYRFTRPVPRGPEVTNQRPAPSTGLMTSDQMQAFDTGNVELSDFNPAETYEFPDGREVEITSALLLDGKLYLPSADGETIYQLNRANNTLAVAPDVFIDPADNELKVRPATPEAVIQSPIPSTELMTAEQMQAFDTVDTPQSYFGSAETYEFPDSREAEITSALLLDGELYVPSADGETIYRLNQSNKTLEVAHEVEIVDGKLQLKPSEQAPEAFSEAKREQLARDFLDTAWAGLPQDVRDALTVSQIEVSEGGAIAYFFIDVTQKATNEGVSKGVSIELTPPVNSEETMSYWLDYDAAPKNPDLDMPAAEVLEMFQADLQTIAEEFAVPAEEQAEMATADAETFRKSVIATFYAAEQHGQPTASGKAYDHHAMTAAHPKLPFGTKIRVTNRNNSQSVVVTVNDRLPPNGTDGMELILSGAAARRVDMLGDGIAEVNIEVVDSEPEASEIEPNQQERINQLKAMIDSSPDDPAKLDWLMELGDLLAEQGETDQAIDTYFSLLWDYPTLDTYRLKLVDSLLVAERFREAAEHYAAFVDGVFQASDQEHFNELGKNALLQDALGDLAMEYNNLDAALAARQEASSIRPDNNEYRQKLAELYWQTDNRDRAMVEMETLRRLDPDNEAFTRTYVLWSLELARENGDTSLSSEMTELLRELFAKDSNDPELRAAHDRFLVSTGPEATASSPQPELMPSSQLESFVPNDADNILDFSSPGEAYELDGSTVMITSVVELDGTWYIPTADGQTIYRLNPSNKTLELANEVEIVDGKLQLKATAPEEATAQEAVRIVENGALEDFLTNPYIVSALFYSDALFARFARQSSENGTNAEILRRVGEAFEAHPEKRTAFFEMLDQRLAQTGMDFTEEQLPLDRIDTGSGPNHNDAIDLFIAEGSEIKAMAGGIVLLAEEGWVPDNELSTSSFTGGNTVVIYNPSTKETYRYAHLESVTGGLKPGDIIPAATVLGRVGHTGKNASQPGRGQHLHLNIFYQDGDQTKTRTRRQIADRLNALQ